MYLKSEGVAERMSTSMMSAVSFLSHSYYTFHCLSELLCRNVFQEVPQKVRQQNCAQNHHHRECVDDR